MKGVIFDDIHSYEDLNLILSEVDIPPAPVKSNYVDIPGADGSADLTESLGEVRYKDRTGSLTFTVFPQDDYEQKKKEVSNLLNGKRCARIILDKDPDYYWTGRCEIDKYQSDKRVRKIVIKVTVAPYKMKIEETVVTVPAGDGISGVLYNSRKTVVPKIYNTDDATVTFNGNVFTLKAGTHTILDFELVAGENLVTITSEGAVRFTYREGDL